MNHFPIMKHHVSLLLMLAFAGPIFAQQAPVPKLSGTVVDDQDQGLAGWIVTVTPRKGGNDEKSAPTSQSGYWAFPNLPPGDYTVALTPQAGHNFYQPVTGRYDDLSLGTRPRSLPFRVTTRGAIVGKVVYADGKPLAGWEVTLKPVGTSTHTNEDGVWGFAHLDNGNYRVEVTMNQGYQLQSPGNPHQDLKVDSNQSLRADPFVVVSEPSVAFDVKQFPATPLEGWTVTLVPKNGSGPSRSALTNAGGRAEFGKVLQGDYLATLTRKDEQGYSFINPADGKLSVKIDKPGDHAFSFTVAKTGSIFGTVYQDQALTGEFQEAYGRMAGVTVYLELDEDGNFDDGDEQSTVTNARGEYTFEGLLADSYLIRIDLPRDTYPVSPETCSHEVTFRNRYQQFERNFGVQKFAEVQGKVYEDGNGNGRHDPGEAGLANRSVTLKAVAGGDPQEVRTDGRGDYRFAKLRQGPYTLTLEDEVGWKQTSRFGLDLKLEPPERNMGSLNFNNGHKCAAVGRFAEDKSWDAVVVAYYNTTLRQSGESWSVDQSHAKWRPLDLDTNVTELLLLDFDADGDQDVLSLMSPGVELLTNQGGRKFVRKTLSKSSLAQGNQFQSGNILADYLSPNAYLDVLCLSKTQGSLLLVTNDGKGGYADQPLSTTSVLGFSTDDVERDGDIDIFTLQKDGVHVGHNQGDGTFVFEMMIPLLMEDPGMPNNALRRIITADFNQDRFPDVAVLRGRGVAIFLNNGAGAFYAGWKIRSFDFEKDYSYFNEATMEVTDIDQDGDQDLLLGSGAGAILLNDGSGSFSQGLFQSDAMFYNIRTFDFDLDGRPDLHYDLLRARRNLSTPRASYQRGLAGGHRYRIDFANRKD